MTAHPPRRAGFAVATARMQAGATVLAADTAASTAVQLMHRKLLTIDAWEGFRTSVQKRKWEQSSLLTQEVANACGLMPERVSAVL
jgi:hypothetical protein